MKFWTLYWIDGRKDFLYGPTYELAAMKAHIGHPALYRLMDHYQEGFDFRYKFDNDTKNWVPAGSPPETLNLYDIRVGEWKFDRQVTEGFLLKDFASLGVWYFQSPNGEQLHVKPESLETLFRWKIESKPEVKLNGGV